LPAPRAEPGGWRACASARSPSRRPGCWTGVGRHALALCRAASARVSVRPRRGDRIFCRDGNVWTSAGITAGIDLALALVEEDHGFAIAKGVPSTSSSTIVATAGNRSSQRPLIWRRRTTGSPRSRYARDHIAEALTVERLAGSAGMSLRQFTRAFGADGTTPARVVERCAPISPAGGSRRPANRRTHRRGGGIRHAENMRRAFIRLYGQPPQSIRRATRS